MKNKFIFRTLTILVLLIIITSCGEDDNPSTPIDEQNTTGTFTDNRDNKTYKWVEVGDQVWMAENLAYKPNIGSFWTLDNNEDNVPTYGYLYGWETAQTIAPVGWHLPSQAEWQALVNYLGGTEPAYIKLVQSGITHWQNPNGATNKSGFSALPTGYFDQRDNSFNGFGFTTMFHSTTEYSGDSESAMGLVLNQNFKKASIEGRPKLLALPVRCVKD